MFKLVKWLCPAISLTRSSKLLVTSSLCSVAVLSPLEVYLNYLGPNGVANKPRAIYKGSDRSGSVTRKYRAE